MYIWIVSTLGLLWIVLLWICVYKYLFEYLSSILWGIQLSRIAGHMTDVFLLFVNSQADFCISRSLTRFRWTQHVSSAYYVCIIPSLILEATLSEMFYPCFTDNKAEVQTDQVLGQSTERCRKLRCHFLDFPTTTHVTLQGGQGIHCMDVPASRCPLQNSRYLHIHFHVKSISSRFYDRQAVAGADIF